MAQRSATVNSAKIQKMLTKAMRQILTREQTKKKDQHKHSVRSNTVESQRNFSVSEAALTFAQGFKGSHQKHSNISAEDSDR